MKISIIPWGKGPPRLEAQIDHTVIIPDIRDLTDEQRARLEHHVEISKRVFEASVRSMLKGVRKYGPEPAWYYGELVTNDDTDNVLAHWLPHIFSEGVDAANQTGLLADTLGVDVLP